MALFLKNEAKDKPWLGILYGQSGVGKTSAAISIDAAIIDLENSSSQYTCMRTAATNSKELYAALKEAYEDDSIKTVAIDTLDACESWFIDEVLAEGRAEFGDKIKELISFPFGGGYARLLDKYVRLCSALEKIATKKCVLVLAHEQVKTVEDPMQGNYDRAILRIYPKAAAHFFGRADFVLYARHEFMVNDGRAVNSKKRAAYAHDGVSFSAKTRLKMPPKFDLTEFAQHVKVTSSNP